MGKKTENQSAGLCLLLCDLRPVSVLLCASIAHHRTGKLLSYRQKSGLKESVDVTTVMLLAYLSLSSFIKLALGARAVLAPFPDCCWSVKDQKMLSPRTTALIHGTRMKALNKRPPPWLLMLSESLCPPLRASAGGQMLRVINREGGEKIKSQTCLL